MKFRRIEVNPLKSGCAGAMGRKCLKRIPIQGLWCGLKTVHSFLYPPVPRSRAGRFPCVFCRLALTLWGVELWEVGVIGVTLQCPRIKPGTTGTPVLYATAREGRVTGECPPGVERGRVAMLLSVYGKL